MVGVVGLGHSVGQGAAGHVAISRRVDAARAGQVAQLIRPNISNFLPKVSRKSVNLVQTVYEGVAYLEAEQGQHDGEDGGEADEGQHDGAAGHQEVHQRRHVEGDVAHAGQRQGRRVGRSLDGKGGLGQLRRLHLRLRGGGQRHRRDGEQNEQSSQHLKNAN